MTKRQSMAASLQAAECEVMRLAERLEAAERDKRHLEAERDQALRDSRSNRRHLEAHRQELLRVDARLCELRDAAAKMLDEFDAESPQDMLKNIDALRVAVERTGKAA